MNRIEPTMPNNATLQKIAHATGDFEQLYQVPTKHSFVATDIEKISQAPTKHTIAEEDLELDENNYLLNPFFPLAYKAA